MSMTTPGPWHVAAAMIGMRRVAHIIRDARNRVIAATKWNEVSGEHFPYGADEAEANARAIAALPQFVEAVGILLDRDAVIVGGELRLPFDGHAAAFHALCQVRELLTHAQGASSG